MKDCCSFLLFMHGIVNMREVEQWVGLKCLTLDFVKYWFGLCGCCLWYNFKLVNFVQFQGLQVSIGRVCTGIPFCLGNNINSFVLKNRNALC